MGITTRGCVITPCEDVFFVSGLVERALFNHVWPRMRTEVEGWSRNPWAENLIAPDTWSQHSFARWRLPSLTLHSSGSVQVDFWFDGEEVALKLSFDGIDPDYHGRKSIGLGMKYSRVSEQVMRIVLEALACLGPTYIDPNDCAGDGMGVTDYPRFGLSEAWEQHLLTEDGEKRWRRLVEAGLLPVETATTQVA